jgi:hypothetical protein
MISAVTHSLAREAKTIGNVAPHLREFGYNAGKTERSELRVL